MEGRIKSSFSARPAVRLQPGLMTSRDGLCSAWCHPFDPIAMKTRDLWTFYLIFTSSFECVSSWFGFIQSEGLSLWFLILTVLKQELDGKRRKWVDIFRMRNQKIGTVLCPFSQQSGTWSSPHEWSTEPVIMDHEWRRSPPTVLHSARLCAVNVSV